MTILLQSLRVLGFTFILASLVGFVYYGYDFRKLGFRPVSMSAPVSAGGEIQAQFTPRFDGDYMLYLAFAPHDGYITDHWDRQGNELLTKRPELNIHVESAGSPVEITTWDYNWKGPPSNLNLGRFAARSHSSYTVTATFLGGNPDLVVFEPRFNVELHPAEQETMAAVRAELLLVVFPLILFIGIQIIRATSARLRQRMMSVPT